ncbi:MAG: endonuclease/exonuclease/phosphatase family protein [Chloroflexi bacterium]|nr:endonuclease/exonuclease/phosphatase family protein [Chloroflexota bacterium]
MSVFKVATINILNDLTHWEARSPLLVEGLAKLDADLVALQEVMLPENNAEWLANQLGFEHVYLSPKTRPKDKREGIAVLSRFPFIQRETLNLGSQSRVAQLVRVDIQGKPVLFVNGHFHWWPGNSSERFEQVTLLLKWLEGFSEGTHLAVCGDFNGTPETSAIQFMRSHFNSAYAVIHGREPQFTAPTPLHYMSRFQTFKQYLLNIAKNRTFKPWRGTLDYIFVNDRVRVLECDLVLNKPAAFHKNLYPSDHFGLAAQLELI